MDKFDRNFSAELAARFKKINAKLDVVKVEETTQPIEIDSKSVIYERWTVYYFTLPVKYTKKIAWGFETKDQAKEFIRTQCEVRNDLGELIPQKMEDDNGKVYEIFYDTIRESREEINVYANDPLLTTHGNDRNKILERWLD